MNTPTPWVVVNNIYIVGGDQAFVTKCSGRLNDKANAALICRAVNSHAALVAALEAMTVRYCTGINELDDEFKQACAALALAKGEA